MMTKTKPRPKPTRKQTPKTPPKNLLKARRRLFTLPPNVDDHLIELILVYAPLTQKGEKNASGYIQKLIEDAYSLHLAAQAKSAQIDAP